jgi:translation initiation factor IF-3
MIGVLSRDEALRMAEEEELDLVEIQPNADPPVCKIMDFGKFKLRTAEEGQRGQEEDRSRSRSRK